jgi:hypothetical protein
MADHTRIPERARFSLLYLRQGAPGPDSKRMRRRLGILISERQSPRLYEQVRAKLGVDVPLGSESNLWVRFFEEAELRDVLDLITLAYDAIQAGRQTLSTEGYVFLEAVNLIFQEEHVTYRADDHGVVHFAVDAEFERNRAATLAGLGQSRFANAASNFHEAYNELSKTPPDGKGAIRAMFDAAENVFKVMYKGEPRLTSAAVRKQLAPVVQRLYSGNGPATAAASKQLDAFCDWIDGCHNYRHEHGQPEVIEPPLEIAVLFVSTGGAYIRWLIDVDAQNNKGGAPGKIVKLRNGRPK